INPFPLTVIFPFALTLASRSAITQIWPAGDTPRTIFRFTVTGEPVTHGAGNAGQLITDETGMTPMPPLNFKSSAAAGCEKTTPRNIVYANAFFIMSLSLPYTQRSAFFRSCLMRLATNASLVKGANACSCLGEWPPIPFLGMNAVLTLVVRRADERLDRISEGYRVLRGDVQIEASPRVVAFDELKVIGDSVPRN